MMIRNMSQFSFRLNDGLVFVTCVRGSMPLTRILKMEEKVMVRLTEDYSDSYAEGFYDSSINDSLDSEHEFENYQCTDEFHFDVIYETYIQGVRDGELNCCDSTKPNIVVGLNVKCCNTAGERTFVRIQDKVNLTISEAAAYSNIGQNRIEKLLRTPNCPFAFFVGTKKLVKRREFEQFINQTLEI